MRLFLETGPLATKKGKNDKRQNMKICKMKKKKKPSVEGK